jgi:hypothetical protein
MDSVAARLQLGEISMSAQGLQQLKALSPFTPSAIGTIGAGAPERSSTGNATGDDAGNSSSGRLGMLLGSGASGKSGTATSVSTNTSGTGPASSSSSNSSSSGGSSSSGNSSSSTGTASGSNTGSSTADHDDLFASSSVGAGLLRTQAQGQQRSKVELNPLDIFDRSPTTGPSFGATGKTSLLGSPFAPASNSNMNRAFSPGPATVGGGLGLSNLSPPAPDLSSQLQGLKIGGVRFGWGSFDHCVHNGLVFKIVLMHVYWSI